jgi:hypothetical protein
MSIKHLAGLCVLASLSTASVSAQEVIFHADQFTVELGKMFRVPIESKLVKGAPYSGDVVTESIQWLSDGNRIAQRSTARVFRDSEGRIRREEDRPSGNPMVSIIDPVAGLSFSLDSERRVAMQTPKNAAVHVMEAFRKSQTIVTRLPPGASETIEKGAHDVEDRLVKGWTAYYEPSMVAVNAASDRVVIERLPARDIEGVRADGVRRTTTIPAGEIGNDLPIEIVSEEWFSPELQVLVLTERKDPRLGTSTYRVVNINRSEPAEYLFEVPSDYTMKPAGVFKKR